MVTGVAFDDDDDDDEDILCHSGMTKAVRYLSTRFRSFLLAMHKTGTLWLEKWWHLHTFVPNCIPSCGSTFCVIIAVHC